MSLQTSKQAILILASLLFCLSFMGCPSTVTTDGATTPDSGNTVPDNATTTEKPGPQTECKAGSACIQVESDKIRGCEFLLTNDKDTAGTQITFDPDVIGESKTQDKRIALGLILRKDADFSATRFFAVMQLKDGHKALKLTQVNCYDRKGAKLSAPKAKLVLK